jgi:Zn-dependent protease with chaperone function
LQQAPAPQKVVRAPALALAVLVVTGCATPSGQTGKADESGKPTWMPNLSSVSSSVSSIMPAAKGEKTPVISELKTGRYEASPLAIGEEKDLAQRRADGIGFVRAVSLAQYLTALRTQLLAGSGVTGVPGRVVVLANPAFAAYSTPDGNIYLAMGWLRSLENADEMAAIVAHELSHVLLTHHNSDQWSDFLHKGQAWYEIAVRIKAEQSKSKTVSKTDAKNVKDVRHNVDLFNDKLLVPEWNRSQEREADLLGVDLMIRASYSPTAMVSMLEKLKAWEDRNKEKNYDSVFQAKKLLDANKLLESFAEAKIAASGSTANDAYPNWILSRAATSLHRQADATAASQRALNAAEPIPQIYEDTITVYEYANNITAALTWTDKASAVFGGAPRWRPVKIRLLRKAGKTAEADAETLSCSTNAQDWRRLCQEANQTPAPGQSATPTTASPKPTTPTPATPAARQPAPRPIPTTPATPPRTR